MKVKWSPQYSSGFVSTYRQSSRDVIVVNEEYEIDFSDTSVYKYDIPEEVNQNILWAYRDTDSGVLHVCLFRPYTSNEKNIWENPGYCDSGFRGSEFEDYGDQEDLI